MYRQYENPRTLQAELDRAKAEFDDIQASGKVDNDTLVYYHDKIEELEARLNYAWQDEEYDEAI